MNQKLFAILFFVSGLCGLMYQILWTRLFSFILGNTYLTISIIVAGFMSGLFLGSWLIGHYISRVENELKWYALLEIVIGAYALLLLVSFGISETLFKGLYAIVGKIAVLHQFSKFLLTFALIAVPTSAMGATLPLAVQYYSKNKKMFGDKISLFYAVNTIGGSLGVLIAGFYLIEQLGISNGLMITAFLNIAIGSIVWVARPKVAIADEVIESTKSKPKKKKKAQRQPQAFENKRIYLIAAGLAGFTALSYEMIWTRGLKFLIHNSTYSFSVILFVFLLGIAVGSALAKKILKRQPNLHYLYGLLQLGLGVYAVFSVYLLYNFSYSDFFQSNVINIIYDFSYSWLWGILIYCLVCSVMFLLPTIFMGMLFPIINELFFRKEPRTAGRTVSSIYAVNTVGSILGALAAGFFLLPVFGIKISIVLIAVVNLLLGLIFVFKSKLKVAPTLAAGWAVFSMVLILSFEGNYLHGRGEKESDRMLFYDEGLMATVKVFDRHNGRFMSIDGNTIASTHKTLFKKEKLIAHLPFLIKPDIKSVLAVGLASGISVGSMSLYENVEKIDCVELIKPVFPAAQYFNKFNFNIFNNSKINLIQNDIYAYMMYHDDKYDLISSDGKLGTLYSGNTIMLSKDFYELSKQRMKKDGIFIQWLPIITPSKELKDILNTLQNSFAYVWIFYFYPTDILMLASESPMLLDKSYIDGVLSLQAIKQDLAVTGISDASTLLAAFVGAYEIDPAEEVNINSFDRPFLEFQYMREWKKSKQWAGGYRARNLEFLLANYEKSDAATVTNFEKTELTNIIKGAKLFYRGGVNYFKTGHPGSFQEYRKFSNRSKVPRVH